MIKKNFNDYYLHPPVLNKYLLDLLPLDLNNHSVLDIGCGLGDWGHLLRTRKTGAFHIDGFDIRQEFLDKIPKGIYNTLWRQDLEISQLIPNYDYVLCVQVIEHIPKNLGKVLLNEINKSCSIKAVITTPYGYMRDPNHKSGWVEKDLTPHGYKCTRLSYQQLPTSLMFADKLRRFFFRKGTGKLLVGVKNFG